MSCNARRPQIRPTRNPGARFLTRGVGVATLGTASSHCGVRLVPRDRLRWRGPVTSSAVLDASSEKVPMSDSISSPILAAGGPPPQRHLLDRTWGKDEEKLLLLAAWAHGLTVEDVIHRYAIFAFVQTHLSRKSEEQMQRTIETSSDWDGQGKGEYKLTNRGLKRIARLYGATPAKANLVASYVLKRVSVDHEFAVEVRPMSHKLVVSVNRIEMEGVEASRRLENLGESFNTKSSSGTSRVWNWIVQEGSFIWQRL